MAVITLKDGSAVTMFEPREAIDIIGKELYDFILTANKYDTLLTNESHSELEAIIDELGDELVAAEKYIQKLENEIEDIKEELKDHLKQVNAYQNNIKHIIDETIGEK